MNDQHTYLRLGGDAGRPPGRVGRRARPVASVHDVRQVAGAARRRVRGSPTSSSTSCARTSSDATFVLRGGSVGTPDGPAADVAIEGGTITRVGRVEARARRPRHRRHRPPGAARLRRRALARRRPARRPGGAARAAAPRRHDGDRRAGRRVSYAPGPGPTPPTTSPRSTGRTRPTAAGESRPSSPRSTGRRRATPPTWCPRAPCATRCAGATAPRRPPSSANAWRRWSRRAWPTVRSGCRRGSTTCPASSSRGRDRRAVRAGRPRGRGVRQPHAGRLRGERRGGHRRDLEIAGLPQRPPRPRCRCTCRTSTPTPTSCSPSSRGWSGRASTPRSTPTRTPAAARC